MAKKHSEENEDYIPEVDAAPPVPPAPPAAQDPVPPIPQPPCEPATEQGRTVALLEKLRATIITVLGSLNAPPEVISRINQIMHDAAAGVPPDKARET